VGRLTVLLSRVAVDCLVAVAARGRAARALSARFDPECPALTTGLTTGFAPIWMDVLDRDFVRELVVRALDRWPDVAPLDPLDPDPDPLERRRLDPEVEDVEGRRVRDVLEEDGRDVLELDECPCRELRCVLEEEECPDLLFLARDLERA